MSYANRLRSEFHVFSRELQEEIHTQLGEMFDRLRAMESRIENFVEPPKPEIRPANGYAPGADWTRTEPKTALTDLEMRVLLRECGVGLREDAHERAAQGLGAQFKALPTTQRFLHQFRARFHRFCPDAPSGAADALLLRLGYEGNFDAEPVDAEA
jgi:hypothetical protein